ncbi:MAG: C39 family peptidase [Clostridia bacterium]|nr:C39 family peptidase [Clostridia bacterium]
MSWIKCNLKSILRIAASFLAASIIMMIMWNHKITPPGTMSGIKPVYQSDYKATVTTIGGQNKSVWTSGCGAVVVAMAAGYYIGEDISCEDLFRWACDNGFYSGNGLGHEALSEMLKPYGLVGRWINNDDTRAVKLALQTGRPVVAHVGPGTFTKNGHYILLIDYKDGQARVNDPGSRDRSGRYFDLDLIRNELRRENSFMIIERI